MARLRATRLDFSIPLPSRRFERRFFRLCAYVGAVFIGLLLGGMGDGSRGLDLRDASDVSAAHGAAPSDAGPKRAFYEWSDR